MSATGFPDPSQDFEGYQASLFKSLLAATGAVNAIPVDDVGFFRSLDAQFQKDITAAGTSSLSIANTLLQQCSTEAGIDGKDIEDIDDIKHRYNLVTEVCDGLLEKTVS
jgi:exosome complex exonuclease RRP6